MSDQGAGASDRCGAEGAFAVGMKFDMGNTTLSTLIQQSDQFKNNSDEITAALNGALAAILGGQSGMDTAFGSGDQESADNARASMGSANFDAARFSGR